MMNEIVMRPGLDGVIAAETRLSHIDGQAGELVIAGYPLAEIAPRASFEEMLYLLWHDRLPQADELADLRARMAAQRELPPLAYALLRAAAARNLDPMEALRMVAGTISLMVDARDHEATALALVASFPTIVAAYWRISQGQEAIAPNPGLGHAANYLYMLNAALPDTAHVRALETYLNTVAEHGMNASTFAARVIIATDSDMVSALVGAIGALKGPRHGGAPGPALDMVFAIGQPERAEPYLRALLDRGEVLMGFGHRVYKVRDPRADVLNAAAEQFFAQGDGADLYALARHVEAEALRLLDVYKPGRNLQTNVEYYTALLLHGLGFSTALFSPTFAVARAAGWTAHALEHRRDAGRIIRPLSAYTGVKDRRWQPLDARPASA